MGAGAAHRVGLFAFGADGPTSVSIELIGLDAELMHQVLPRAIVLDDGDDPNGSSEQAGFGFQDLISILVSQRYFICAVFALISLLGAAFAFTRSPEYTATALVALGDRSAINIGGNSGAGAPPPDATLAEAEGQVITSNDLMIRLINLLGPEVTAEKIDADTPAKYAGLQSGDRVERDLVELLLKHLSVRRQEASNIIEVSFTTHTPEASVLLSNSLVEAYLASKNDERLDAAARASAWLNDRVEQLRLEVESKEAAVAAYRSQVRLLTIDGATITEQQFFRTQEEVLTARAELAAQQARMRQIQQVSNSANPDAILDALSSPSIQALRSKEAEVAGRQAELSIRYGERHPSTLQVKRERDEVRDQIDAEITRIRSSQANEVEIARIRLQELEAGLSQFESRLEDGNRDLVRLRELERDAQVSSEVYQDFLLRAREIAEQESLKVTDARLLSRAIEPSAPSSASPKLLAVFFVAVALFLAFFAALLRSAMHDRIVRPETITRRLGAYSLGSVPAIRSKQLRQLPPDERTPEDYIVAQPMTRFAESLRVLNSSILQDVTPDKGMTLAVTSAVSAEGKTTLSLCLGRTAALSGLRVLVIDCDSRRPSLSAVVSSEDPVVTLTDVINGDVAWKAAVVPDHSTPAFVLPIAMSAPDMRSMFRTDAARAFLAELQKEFDLIVLDCPPILAVADARWFVAAADKTLIVARWNNTRRAAVATALREAHRSKGNIAGVILNRVDVSVTRSFSFNDPLYYGNAGKGYYTS